MVICHCNAVNDRRIRSEILAGAIDADWLEAQLHLIETIGVELYLAQQLHA